VVRTRIRREGARTAPFDGACVVGVALPGFVISDEFPDRWTWFGATIIISTGLCNFYCARRLQRG
jgi:hypothetical protein